MLKTSRSITSPRPGKGRNRFDDDSKDEFNDKIEDGKDEFDDKGEISNDKICNNKIGNNEVTKKKNHRKISRFKKTVSLVILGFFTPRTRLAVTKLKQKFVKPLILYYFEPELNI